jgi:hypothetical protein
MMNDQSIWHCEERKGQKFKLIVLPCYGKPYIVKNPMSRNVPSVEQPNTFKTMKEIVQGRVESISRRYDALIHPIFREEHKEWDIVGKFFQEYFGLYLGEDGAVKDITKKKFHEKTCVFVNEEGGCGGFTPNMATIVPGRDERKGQCPHLWGEIGIRVYGKDRIYFKDILKTMSIEEANDEETNLYEIEERQKEEQEEEDN